MELRNLFQTIKDAGSIKAALRSLNKTATTISTLLDAIDAKAEALETLINEKDSVGMVSAMQSLRKEVDDLERILADSSWPLPKYRELLFIY